MRKSNTNTRVRNLCVLALFVAVEIALQVMGLGMIPVGPFNATTLIIPVALGAMLLGPWQGAVLGFVFGACSFYSSLSGVSMTGIFLQLNPVSTAVLCMGTRMLVGLTDGLIFRALHKIDRTQTVSYYVGALLCALLNTLFFMGYVMLFFYRTDYIQSKVVEFGAAGPITLLLAWVGVQALVEAAVCCALGGTVAKGVAKALKL